MSEGDRIPPPSTAERLVWMSEYGSSIDLNYGEDNNLWECSWITSGKRYTAFSKWPATAVAEALRRAGVALA